MRLSIIYHCLPFLLLPTVTPLTLPNIVDPEGFLSLHNVSGPSNVSASEGQWNPTVLPYGYKVPFTDMALRLGFGVFRRQPLDGFEMNRLITEAQEIVNGYIRKVGRDELVPKGPANVQEWTHWMASGNGPLELCVYGWEANAPKKISWGQVALVLEGLKTYLIDGKRYWVTTFNFMEEKSWLRGGVLGSGYLRESTYTATSS